MINVCQLAFTDGKKKLFLTNNSTFCQTMLTLTVILVLFVLPITSITIQTYNSASFQPTSPNNILTTLTAIPTSSACACQCLNNTQCVTGNFYGINQTCVLFSSSLSQGQLYLINNALASVFSFPNRTTKLRK